MKLIAKISLFNLIFLSLLFVNAVAQPTDNIEDGVQLFEAKQYEAAKRYFEMQKASDPTNHQALYYLGRIEYDNNQLDEAVDYFKKSIELERENSTYYLWLGRAYLQKLQNANFFEKAILSGRVKESFQKSVKYDSSNVEAMTHLSNYYLNAPSIAGGSKKKALAQAQEIIRYDAKQGKFLIAQIYARQKKYDQALIEYRELLALYPDDIAIYYSKGVMHQQAEQYDAAFAAFEKALENDPKAMHVIYQIGRTGVFSGQRLDRAIECMKIYVVHEPGEGMPSLDAAHWRLGMLYEKAEKAGLAKQAYEKAQAINPQEEKYKEALANLQN